MKLRKLIQELQSLKKEYVKKYPEYKDPDIYSINPDEGILICSKLLKNGCITTAKRPYLQRKINFDGVL